ncbi:MAG: hypothetical protein JWO41_926 [Candidatus Saccharibacteria bacterium]|nr:hypothetical protein [Candidatus Saccharibacteria bacterium]
MRTPTPKGLRKYQIGLAVLGAVTLAMLAITVVQAQAAKADDVTYKAAQNAAEKLQAYTTAKDSIPASLAAAGVNSAPDSIKYTKLSSTKYQFCVTYKSESAFSSSDVQSRLLSGVYGSSFSSKSGADATESSYLYLTPNHKKGQTCQTIKPYIYTSSSYFGGSSSSSSSVDDIYTKCDKLYPDSSQTTEYFACIKNGTNSSSSQTLTN